MYGCSKMILLCSDEDFIYISVLQQEVTKVSYKVVKELEINKGCSSINCILGRGGGGGGG